MNELKIGDVVCLKSQPELKFTVNNTTVMRGQVEIVWFNIQTNQFNYAQVSPNILCVCVEKG